MNAREEVLRTIYGDKYDTFSTGSSNYEDNVIVTVVDELREAETSYEIEKLSGEVKSLIGIECLMLDDPFEVYVSFENQQVIEYFKTMVAWGEEFNDVPFVEFNELEKTYYQGIEEKASNLSDKVASMTDNCIMEIDDGTFGTPYLHSSEWYVDYQGTINDVKGLLYMIPIVDGDAKRPKMSKEVAGVLLAFKESLATHAIELQKQDDLNVPYYNLVEELKSNGTLKNYSERSARVLRKKIK